MSPLLRPWKRRKGAKSCFAGAGPYASLPGRRGIVCTERAGHRAGRNLMSQSRITRREVNLGLAAASTVFIGTGRARAADFTLKHNHNLPVDSPLHKRATEMWAAVKAETNGRVDVQITRGGDGGAGQARRRRARLHDARRQRARLARARPSTCRRRPTRSRTRPRSMPRSTATSAPICARKRWPRASMRFPADASRTACIRSRPPTSRSAPPPTCAA